MKTKLALWTGGAMLVATVTISAALAEPGTPSPSSADGDTNLVEERSDDELVLQEIPADAPVKVAERSGSGNSESLEFTPGQEYFTILVTCQTSGDASRLYVVDANDPTYSHPVVCDGAPESITVNEGGAAREAFYLEARETISWVAAVYVGMPDSVSVS